MCPSGSGGPDSLWVFGVQGFQLLTETLEQISLESTIRHHVSLLAMEGPKLYRDFKTLVSPLLLHMQGAKVHVPYLYWTTIGPLHCDLMTNVAPPPDLLISSDLEDFLSVQRPRLFLLLWVHLLDFAYTYESVISSELDPLEDFSFPRIPFISGI
jgi:hypothetical protein